MDPQRVQVDSMLQSPEDSTKAPRDDLKLTTRNERGVGSHGERIGDGGRHEPWAFQPASQAHASGKMHGRHGYRTANSHEISNL